MEEDNQPQNKFIGRPSLVKVEKVDVSSDVKKLRAAFRFFANKRKIVEVLCSRTSRQRTEIAKAYKTCYDRELRDEIKRKFHGDFCDLLIALVTPFKEFYCEELYDALDGSGTNEDKLIQILVTLSNRELFDVGQRYLKNYGRTLETDLKTDLRGNFKKLMVSLANGTRDESNVLDFYEAKLDAAELKRAGNDRWGNDASIFNRIFCLRNFDQIRLLAQEYASVTGYRLEADIKKEFSGDIEDGLLAILIYSNNRSEFFARCLFKSMAGVGTDDKSLIRLVVSRAEVDMIDIKEEFERKYEKSLKSFIKSDTSGHYRKALMKLIGE